MRGHALAQRLEQGIAGRVEPRLEGQGRGAAVARIAFDEQDAIARGESDAVPEGIDLQYAVAAALVRRALQARDGDDPASLYGHLLVYAGRLPQRELGVMLVADLYRAVGQPLCESPRFATWAGQVADVMLTG